MAAPPTPAEVEDALAETHALMERVDAATKRALAHFTNQPPTETHDDDRHP